MEFPTPTTARMFFDGHLYTINLTACKFAAVPGAGFDSWLVLTPVLTSDDGTATCQVSLPFLSGADAQRVVLRVLFATGRAASFLSAVAAVATAIAAAGGVVRFDPNQP